MQNEIRIPGAYEIWNQKKGLGPQHVISLYSRRDVKAFLEYRAIQEAKYGFKVKRTDGGFSAYVRRGAKLIPVKHYWFEQVVPDEAVKLDADLEDLIAVAMFTAGAEVRARNEAVAAASSSGEAGMTAAELRFAAHLRRIAADHRERMRIFRLSKADEEVARLEAERCEARAAELEGSSRAA